MATSVSDRKKLWGQSGNRCAICRVELAGKAGPGGVRVIGEEAHIVAQSPAFVRGDAADAPANRDTYEN